MLSVSEKKIDQHKRQLQIQLGGKDLECIAEDFPEFHTPPKQFCRNKDSVVGLCCQFKADFSGC